MATVEIVLEKVKELERRCPGTHIHRDRLDELASDEPMVCGRFRLDSPSSHGGIATFVVDLAEMGLSMDQWLDNEIPRHEPSNCDEFYRVWCPVDGSVQIGVSGYNHQMSLPDARWICPKCGSVAEFDDDTYESMFDEVPA